MIFEQIEVFTAAGLLVILDAACRMCTSRTRRSPICGMGKPVNQNGFSDGRRNPVASQRTFRRQFVTVTDLLEITCDRGSKSDAYLVSSSPKAC